jgi:hypothetical protein
MMGTRWAEECDGAPYDDDIGCLVLGPTGQPASCKGLQRHSIHNWLPGARLYPLLYARDSTAPETAPETAPAFPI